MTNAIQRGTNEPNRDKQEYMGTITVHRCSGQVDLFASDVSHQNFIEVAINHASIERNLSTNWIHGSDEIVSVRMSEIQWAQFVSSFNQGSGTPVTIAHINRRRITPPPPPTPESDKFKEELKKTAMDSLHALQEAITKLTESALPKAKPMTKADMHAVLDNLKMAQQEFVSNIPFVEEQFREHVEGKLSEAKCEFEGYIGNRLREMGLEAAQLKQAEEQAPRPRFILPAPEKG